MCGCVRESSPSNPSPATGAYLLDGGDVLFLWLGDQLPPQFVQDLFGVQTKFEVPDAAEVEFGDSSALASKMALIVSQLRRDRNGNPPSPPPHAIPRKHSKP